MNLSRNFILSSNIRSGGNISFLKLRTGNFVIEFLKVSHSSGKYYTRNEQKEKKIIHI